MIYGILCFYRPWMIAQGARQFFLLSIFISAVVNMSLLDSSSLSYIHYG
ncbi:hypothetical protein KBB05_04150 [Patescibacteria group bacterium]|nr:hypothetical protein [Patescibacteria group bacterium]